MIRMGEASNPDLLVHHLVKLPGFYPVSELRWHVTHACIIVPHNIYIIDVYIYTATVMYVRCMGAIKQTYIRLHAQLDRSYGLPEVSATTWILATSSLSNS